MQYRQMGRSGVRVSVVGVGCNRIGRTVDQAGTQQIVHRALDAGINFFDSANIYGAAPGDSETLLGNALAGLWERVVLATKFSSQMGEGTNEHGGSRYHAYNALTSSLRRLKTDHIDLYYIHNWDPTTPLEETMRALNDLIQSGHVRYIGASNFAAWQLSQANALAEMMKWNEFVVVQSHYHMLKRDIEHELVPYCRYAHVGIVPYFPLAGGFLTGKYERGKPASGTRAGYVQPYLTDHNLDVIDQLREFAHARSHTVGELAIAWLLGEPQVCSVIAGATNADQISANAKAGEWNLHADELKQLRHILEGKQA